MAYSIDFHIRNSMLIDVTTVVSEQTVAADRAGNRSRGRSICRQARGVLFGENCRDGSSVTDSTFR